jgi:hypothetical protein
LTTAKTLVTVLVTAKTRTREQAMSTNKITWILIIVVSLLVIVGLVAAIMAGASGECTPEVYFDGRGGTVYTGECA